MAHRSKLILATILVVAATSFAGTWLTSPGKGSHASVAAAVWYTSIDPASTNTTTGVSQAGQSFAGVVTVTTGGSATKVRVWCQDVNIANVGGRTIKVGLFNSSGTRLGSGSLVMSSVTSNMWIEVTLTTPVTVTSATTYIVGWMNTDGAAFAGRHLSGQPSGSGKQEFSETFAGYPSASISFSNVTEQYSVGIYVE